MFCTNCGQQLLDGSKFCPNCGSPVAQINSFPPPQGPVGAPQPQRFTGTPQPERAPGMCRITFRRPHQVFLINFAMQVFVDSVCRLSIEDGAEGYVDMPRGPHQITIKSSFHKTNMDVRVETDAVVELKWNRAFGIIDTKILP